VSRDPFSVIALICDDTVLLNSVMLVDSSMGDDEHGNVAFTFDIEDRFVDRDALLPAITGVDVIPCDPATVDVIDLRACTSRCLSGDLGVSDCLNGIVLAESDALGVTSPDGGLLIGVNVAPLMGDDGRRVALSDRPTVVFSWLAMPPVVRVIL